MGISHRLRDRETDHLSQKSTRNPPNGWTVAITRTNKLENVPRVPKTSSGPVNRMNGLSYEVCQLDLAMSGDVLAAT